jgi:hypothetical protein
MQHSIASRIVDFFSLYVLTGIAAGIGHPPDNFIHVGAADG